MAFEIRDPPYKTWSKQATALKFVRQRRGDDASGRNTFVSAKSMFDDLVGLVEHLDSLHDAPAAVAFDRFEASGVDEFIFVGVIDLIFGEQGALMFGMPGLPAALGLMTSLEGGLDDVRESRESCAIFASNSAIFTSNGATAASIMRSTSAWVYNRSLPSLAMRMLSARLGK